jgi:NAD(P)-dependent dehydrogenase (short-subunit alcohol dehydrogenase family)
MSIRFDNRVAVVTGSGAGLGRAHALLLASRGAKVVINDPGRGLDGAGSSSAVADQVVAEIRAAGGQAVANYDSVADRAGATNIIRTALDTFGRIDIVVNNAGVLRDKTFAKMSLDDFEFVMQVHFTGSVYVTKAAWPHMMQQDYGRIVFTSSPAGLIGSFGQSNYASAKTALIGLMNNLKNECSKANIKVNLLSPVAGTRMTAGIMSPERMALQTPENVSPAVGWLCSEQCDVSGQIVAASAGYFTSVHLMKAEGVVFDPAKPATLEEFHTARAQIFNTQKLEPFTATLDAKAKQLVGIK